jgi:molybdate transport system regulatory protein
MTRLTIRIDFDNGQQIGHGKIRLLELIAAHGSISHAAREMGMSYRRAWLLVDELNKVFREPLALTQTGGSKGGGAGLTKLGKAVVTNYRKIETETTPGARAALRALASALAARSS